MNEGTANKHGDDRQDLGNATLPPIDFSTFLLSLGSSAQVNMGLVPTPDGEKMIDLPAAKQIIDILAILEEKTRGNLQEAEGKLLSSLLYDLRIQYCDASNRDET